MIEDWKLAGILKMSLAMNPYCNGLFMALASDCLTLFGSYLIAFWRVMSLCSMPSDNFFTAYISEWLLTEMQEIGLKHEW